MILSKNPRDKTIAEQVASIRTLYPNFRTPVNTSKLLKTVGNLQPTSRSDIYTIEVKYTLGEYPKIYVLSPGLVKNSKNEAIPHLYRGKKLCLFRPKYREFKFSDYLTETIIPWTSLWLYHYEVWHTTGVWHGGGEHPGDKL